MSFNDKEIVVTIDAKRLMAIAILTVITVSTLYSYIVALFAFVAPYPGTYPFEASGDTYDTSNNLQSTFSRGSTVRVMATVEKSTGYYTNAPPDYTSYTSISGSSSYRVFIQVLDSNTPAQPYKSCYTTTGSLTQGGTKQYTADFTIGSGASTGHYTVLVLVWSDKLPNGRSLTPTVEMFSFEVT
jgi:hypothetical protein